MSTVRLGHLYPREMNIYADRGNIAVFRARLRWRDHDLDVTPIGLSDAIDPAAHDLFYLGGGQDRDQAIVAEDLCVLKADALVESIAGGATLLAVCGGYQLAGHGYTDAAGGRMPGLGILDADTVAGDGRLIGDLVVEAELDGERRTLVGFENHVGRTRVGPRSRALGRVVSGHGNNGEDGAEGAVSGRVVGTYLHGPLLPKNPWLADIIIGWAIEHRTGRRPNLSPLADNLERAARRVAAGRPPRR